MWQRYLAFEAATGTPADVDKLAKRHREAYRHPEPVAFTDLIEKYHFVDLWPCPLEYRTALARMVAEKFTATTPERLTKRLIKDGLFTFCNLLKKSVLNSTYMI